MSYSRNVALDFTVSTRQAFQRAEFEEALRLSNESFENGHGLVLSEVERVLCFLVAGEADQALVMLNQLLQQAPGDGRLLALSACALEIQGNLSEAVRLYRKVLATGPQTPLVNANLGYLLLTRGNVSGSIACLRRVADAATLAEPAMLYFPSFDAAALPAPTGTEADLRISAGILIVGMKMQELGRFSEARECFEQAIRVYPGNGSAYSGLTLSRKITTADAEFVRSMEEALKREDLWADDRVEIGIALGKALDDLGRYGEAMSQFDEAHAVALQAPGAGFDREQIQKRVDDTIRLFSKERIEAYKGYRSTSDVPILIVGMIRSGTTLVEQVLSSHPDVAAGDELMFWRDRGGSADAGLPSLQEAASLAGSYLSLLREIDPEAKRVTDKMPTNFMQLGIAHLIFPNAKFVCCLRNPVDTCLSIYMTNFRQPMGYVHSRSDLVFFHHEFERLMAHWREVLPSDRLIEVQYESLLSDQEAETRRLIEFCGLDWDATCLQPESNRRVVKTASVWQVRQAVFKTSQERWRRYEPWLGELAELLPEGAARTKSSNKPSVL